MNIAIDGPGGAGKSTIAKFLAKKMGILYLDTGAMYRATAWFVRKYGVDPANEQAVMEVLPLLDLEIHYQGETQIVMVGGEDVTPYLREHTVSMDASTVSKIPAVRLKLVEIQREIAAKSDCVLDGRDIGSYVLPNAEYKIFLTASPEERARRRHLELQQKGQNISYNEVLSDINARDYQDSHRDFAPLRCMPDATQLDTTNMTIEEVATAIEKLVCKS